jgi:hypothetical protein
LCARTAVAQLPFGGRSAAFAMPTENITEFQIRQTGRAAMQLPPNAGKEFKNSRIQSLTL